MALLCLSFLQCDVTIHLSLTFYVKLVSELFANLGEKCTQNINTYILKIVFLSLKVFAFVLHIFFLHLQHCTIYFKSTYWNTCIYIIILCEPLYVLRITSCVHVPLIFNYKLNIGLITWFVWHAMENSAMLRTNDTCHSLITPTTNRELAYEHAELTLIRYSNAKK